MDSTGDRVPDTARQIEDVLAEARRYWRAIGVPWSERQRHLEKLHTHLTEATAQGRSVWEVVGPDPTRFAARWVGGSRRFPWSSIALRFVAAAALTLGAIALLGPWRFGLERFGLRKESFVVVAVAAVASLAVDVARRYRARLARHTVTILGVAGVLTAGVLGGTLMTTLAGAPYVVSDVVELPVLLVLALFAGGAGSTVLASKLRTTARARS